MSRHPSLRIHRAFRCWLLAAALIATCPWPTDARSIEDVLDEGFQGVALVAKGEEILFRGGRGANIRTGRALLPEAPFMVGSVSKPITAILVLQQVEAGRIGLDESVCTYLPNFPREVGERITIRHLLWHTSGLPHYSGFLQLGYTREAFFATAFTPAELVEAIGRMRTVGAPGEQFLYSSPGYMLLGAVLESATGSTYAELIHDRLVAPLGLRATRYPDLEFLRSQVTPDVRFRRHTAWEVLRTFRMGQWEEVLDRDPSSAFAAGGVCSSVDDLWAITRALRANTLLSAETGEIMFAPNEHGYSLGWFRNYEDLLRRNMHVRLDCHGGEYVGYRAFWALYDDDTTILLLSHADGFHAIGLVHDLHLAANGLDRAVKDFIHPSLRGHRSFEQEGGIAAFKHYHEELSVRAGYDIHPSGGTLARVVEIYLSEGESDEAREVVSWSFARRQTVPENVLNEVGYAFLQGGEIGYATELFERAVRSYPRSPNTHDGLGEAYREAGDFGRAVQSYEEAVRLAALAKDPDLDGYRKRLEATRALQN